MPNTDRPTAASSLREWRRFLEQLDAAPRSPRDGMADSLRFLSMVEGRLDCSYQYEVGVTRLCTAPCFCLAKYYREDYAARARASESESDNRVAVWEEDGVVRLDQCKLIVSTIAEFGLLYAPTWVLTTGYTGKARPPRSPTWGERLFG